MGLHRGDVLPGDRQHNPLNLIARTRDQITPAWRVIHGANHHGIGWGLPEFGVKVARKQRELESPVLLRIRLMLEHSAPRRKFPGPLGLHPYNDGPARHDPASNPPDLHGAQPTLHPVIGSLFAQRYQIESQLAKSSNVWVATDTNQNMKVALKVFDPGTPTIHAYSEAQLLTALEGEHILRVYNADTFVDIPYIATRIASLGSTEDYLSLHPQGVRPDLVVSWARQALVGLGACHDRALAHRDIKPANIFLDSEHRALLGDFGLAHPIDDQGRVPMEGTPLTMAPEMWARNEGTAVSDIYSMGVTIYRLITGAWPLYADTKSAFRPLVLAGRFPRVREIAPHVTRRLATRIEKAMALDPADRYQGWRDMHDDLSQIGVVTDVWERTVSHPGHRMCWYELHRPARGGLREVCVMPDGAGPFAIDVRRASGAQSKIHALSRPAVREASLTVELRKVFDQA